MQFTIVILTFSLLLALVSARIDPQNLKCLGVCFQTVLSEFSLICCKIKVL